MNDYFNSRYDDAYQPITGFSANNMPALVKCPNCNSVCLKKKNVTRQKCISCGRGFNPNVAKPFFKNDAGLTYGSESKKAKNGGGLGFANARVSQVM